MTHGGALRKTRQAALERLTEDAIRREIDRAYAAWQKLLFEWQVQRVLTTSRLLKVPVEEVTRGHIVWCHAVHGEPPLDTHAPKITDVPPDGRTRRGKSWPR